MRTVLALLTLFGFGGSALAESSKDDLLQQMYAIRCGSVESHLVGSWVKIEDAHQREVTIEVAAKNRSGDDWLLTTTVTAAKDDGKGVSKPPQITTACRAKVGPQGGPVSVEDGSIKIGDRTVVCKVFTVVSGQKSWLSQEIPGGGFAKIVSPDGQVVLKVVEISSK